MNVEIVDELLPLLDAGSPPPEIAAVLLTLVLPTVGFTVIVMGLGFVAPAAMTVELVQVTVPAAKTQAQPVPVAETKVSPAGSVSVTVYTPLVGAEPSVLFTEIVRFTTPGSDPKRPE